MINKISDTKVQQTAMEETTQPQEPQAQNNIAPEAESLVQATPEYKSGLIAEQRLAGQTQELLLGNQLNSQISTEDSNKVAFQNDTRTPTFTRDNAPPTKPVLETVTDTAKQIPGQLKSTLGAIGEAWSDPIGVISDATTEAKRKLDDIKAGK
jgi:hypothetical protein